jgi:hypothetical protein
VEQQGGPANLEDKKIMALVAYLQSLGTDVARSEQAQAPESDTPDTDTPDPDVTADVTADAGR